MKLTVIGLMYSEGEGFDAGPLEAFCGSHVVRGWVEHFFMYAGRPQLALVIEYEDLSETARGGERPRRERNVRRDLAVSVRPVYDRLREWRSLRARQDGVPVYVVFSNRELAAIAAAMPRSKEALGGIEGVGKAKLGKYAEEVFEVLGSFDEAGDGTESRLADE